MPECEVVYYRASDGSQPAAEFVAALPARQRASIEDAIRGLTETSSPAGDLHELHCDGYRIVYRRSMTLVVVLHVYPEGADELEIAAERWEDFRARMFASRTLPSKGI